MNLNLKQNHEPPDTKNTDMSLSLTQIPSQTNHFHKIISFGTQLGGEAYSAGFLEKFFSENHYPSQTIIHSQGIHIVTSNLAKLRNKVAFLQQVPSNIGINFSSTSLFKLFTKFILLLLYILFWIILPLGTLIPWFSPSSLFFASFESTFLVIHDDEMTFILINSLIFIILLLKSRSLSVFNASRLINVFLIHICSVFATTWLLPIYYSGDDDHSATGIFMFYILLVLIFPTLFSPSKDTIRRIFIGLFAGWYLYHTIWTVLHTAPSDFFTNFLSSFFEIPFDNSIFDFILLTQFFLYFSAAGGVPFSCYIYFLVTAIYHSTCSKISFSIQSFNNEGIGSHQTINDYSFQFRYQYWNQNLPHSGSTGHIQFSKNSKAISTVFENTNNNHSDKERGFSHSNSFTFAQHHIGENFMYSKLSLLFSLPENSYRGVWVNINPISWWKWYHTILVLIFIDSLPFVFILIGHLLKIPSLIFVGGFLFAFTLLVFSFGFYNDIFLYSPTIRYLISIANISIISKVIPSWINLSNNDPSLDHALLLTMLSKPDGDGEDILTLLNSSKQHFKPIYSVYSGESGNEHFYFICENFSSTVSDTTNFIFRKQSVDDSGNLISKRYQLYNLHPNSLDVPSKISDLTFFGIPLGFPVFGRYFGHFPFHYTRCLSPLLYSKYTDAGKISHDHWGKAT